MVLEVRIPVDARDFSPKRSIPALRPIHAPVGVPKVKRPEYEVNHLVPILIMSGTYVCTVFTSKSMFIYVGHLESKERLRIQPAQLFNFS